MEPVGVPLVGRVGISLTCTLERVMLSTVRLLLKCALFGVYVNCVYYSVTVYLVTYTVVSWSTRAEPRWNGVEDPSLEGVVL